ncbi:CcdB family protein [Sedimentitalea sp. JM2-8]|uniref:Toxin CcdB n=1 Tax=Sedimentitalea xiamensis TaxID=3050037 RepID=A0ABT7FEG6_9RHOB|nr:CcdB family protein [Sedimentitalea xiamensis]MDK3073482.1 CcdB family protein [Sedimentitalea xiamensis]
MTAQFDLYRMAGGPMVVILQSDLLDQLNTRVVAPLVPAHSVNRVLRSLNPVAVIGEESFLVMPQLAATLTLGELGTRIGSLAVLRDDILRAMDALLSGI